MATATNGIATYNEAAQKLESPNASTNNICCTKASAISLGADLTKLVNYSSNQLVKYSDISAAVLNFLIHIYCLKSAKTFYLAKEFIIPVSVTVTFTLEYDSGNDTIHTVTISQSSANSSKYVTASYSYPVAWTNVKFTPSEFSYNDTKYKFVSGRFNMS